MRIFNQITLSQNSRFAKYFSKLSFLFLLLVVCFFTTNVKAQVSLAFSSGYLGTQQSAVQNTTNIKNLASLGIARVSFSQADVNGDGLFGDGGTQGNDLAGVIKLYLTSGSVISLNGALNWRETTGNTVEVFGLIFDAGQNATISYGTNQTYSIVGGNTNGTSTSIGLRAYASSFVFTDGTSRSGNAATSGLLADLNTELTSSPQPSTITLTNTSVIEGQNLVYTVTLSAATTSGRPQVYTFKTSGSATKINDYNTTYTFSNGVVNNGDGTITVPGGVINFTITVATIDDIIVENIENVLVSIGSKSALGSIADNDNLNLANCDPNSLYDNIVSGYHQSIAKKSDGTFAVWGNLMSSNGSSNILSPQTLNTTNYPGLVGTPLKSAVGGAASSSNSQAIVLTTDGLYAWGSAGNILATSLTSNLDAFAKINTPTGGDGSTKLPSGVAPGSVKMMVAFYQTLVLVTNSGNVWVLTQTNGELRGVGSTTGASTTWNKVKIDGSTDLTNVIAVRGMVDNATHNGLMALTADGKVYVWGKTVYLGNNTAVVSKSFATLMTLPTEFSSTNLPKMIAVTGGSKTGATCNNTFYILSNNGVLYGLGDNQKRQIGDFTTTERLVWTPAKINLTTNFSNINFISAMESDPSDPAVVVITKSGGMYTWGFNAKNMIGRPTADDSYDPGVPGGFTLGTDKAIFAEMGGHTLVYIKEGSSQFCYVGHRVNGSMGDGSTTDATETSFNCSGTPTLSVCGSVPVIASTTTSTISANPTSITANGTSTSNVTVQLKEVYGNNLTSTGGTVTISSDKGSISSVTDNNNGTYSALLTSSTNAETANLTYTLNGNAGTNTATVNFVLAAPTPVITTTGTLKTFASCSGCNIAAQSFTVSGVDLSTNNIVVTAPAGFEVSTSANSGFATSIPLAPASGTVTTTTVYVKLTDNSTSAASGVISVTSTGATTKTITAIVNTDNGLKFDGSDKVSLPTSVINGLTNFTFEAWVNPSSLSSLQRLFDGGIDQNKYMFFAIHNGYPYFAISNNGYPTLQSTRSIPLNTWSHLAFVLDDASNLGTFYINGQSVYSGPMNKTPSEIGNMNYADLGMSSIYPGENYNGKMDEVRIWSTARTASQISANYQTELIGNETGLVAYYNMNKGIANGTNTGLTTLEDKTAAAKNGTLNTFALTGTISNYVAGFIPEITGTATTNVGSSSTLSNTLTGGTWSSANTSIANVNNATGVVTGVAAGTVTISYTICDKVVSTVFTVIAPTITTTGTLKTFASCSGCTVAPQSFTVSGANLTANIVVTAPTGFQVSTSANSGFATSIPLTPASGTVTTTTVYVKLTDNATSAASGVISVTSTGATSKTITATVNTDNALNFDATTHILTSNPIFTDGQQNFTMEFWINPTDATQTWRGIIGGYVTSQTDRVPSIWQFGRKLHFDVVGYNTTTSYGGYTVDVLNIGKWNHVAFVKDGAQIKLFVNGTQVEIYLSGYTGSSQLYRTAPAQFKAVANYKLGMVDNNFNGAIDEIKFWNSAKSLTDIVNNMYTESVGNETGLLAYFQFNEGSIGSTTNGITLTSKGSISISPTASASTNIVAGFIPVITATGSATSVAVSNTLQLSNSLTGGTWSSANTSIANVNSTTGVVTGVSAGTATISYTICDKVVTKTMTVVLSPNITLTGTLNNFTTCAGTASAAQTFTITGSNLTNDIVLTAPTGYEMSTTSAGVYSATITLTQVSGVVSATPIYVRLTAAAVNAASGNISATSTGATTKTVSVGTAVVNELPTISGTLTACTGTTTTLTGSGTANTSNPWISASTTVATINSVGEVTALSEGSTLITYVNSDGCSINATVTVGAAPADFTISGNQTICMNGTTTLTALGNSNALNFDGTNDYVATASNIAALDITADITLETWIYINAQANDWARIIGKGSNSSRTYGLWLHPNGQLLLQFYGPNGNSPDLITNQALTTGRWYHIAATRSGSAMKMYIDGVLAASATYAGTPASNTMPLQLGFGTNHTYFKGKLDEVRVWNIARSQAEISANKDIELSPQTGLVAYYKFNQGIAGGTNTSITSVADASGNNYNATLNNFSLNNSTSNFVASKSESLTGTWTSADPTFATVNSTGVVTSVAAGTTSISFTVTNASGCTNSKTLTVTVSTAPAPTTITSSILNTTMCANTPVTLTAGTTQVGNAITLNGTNQQINVANGYASTDDLTYEAWVYPTNLDGGSFRTIINHDGWNTGYVHFQFHANKLQFALNGNSDKYSTYTFSNNTWYHVAAVYSKSAGTVKFYVNGTLTNTEVETGITIPAALPYTIGSWSNGRHFGGYMDEIRIWNTARTASQILENKDAIIPASSSGLVAYYKADESTGTTLADATSNNSNGTLVNGASWLIPSTSPVSGTGASSYLWNDPSASTTSSITIAPSQSTIYTVTTTDANGCTASASKLVNIINGPGRFGNAMKLDGTDDHAVVSNNIPAITANLTAEAWVKLSSNTADVNILSWGASSNGDNAQLRVNNQGNLVFGMNSYTGGISWTGFQSYKVINDNQWHHVAMVKTDTLYKLYIDGLYLASYIMPHVLSVNQFSIGSYISYGNHSQHFPGLIDEVRIWNVAKTQSELTTAMNIELAGTEQNLAAYYNFNHGVAGGTNTALTSLIDISTNGRNGLWENLALNGSSSNFVAGNNMTVSEITGNRIVLQGGMTQLSNSVIGGVWALSNTSVGSIDQNGLFTANNNSVGNTNVTYTLTSASGAGCSIQKTTSLTIDPKALIQGPSSIPGNEESEKSIYENSTPVFEFTVNEPVTWSIVGGADIDLLQINSVTGELSFIEAPDYELPTDADGNNTYIVIIEAVDNVGNVSYQTVTITVLDVNEQPQGGINAVDYNLLSADTIKIYFNASIGTAPFTLILSNSVNNVNDTITNINDGDIFELNNKKETIVYSIAKLVDANGLTRTTGFTKDTTIVNILNPLLLLTLKADAVKKLPDNSFTTQLNLKIKNAGELDLNNVQVIANLSSIFPSYLQYNLDSIKVISGNIVLNPNYTGNGSATTISSIADPTYSRLNSTKITNAVLDGNYLLNNGVTMNVDEEAEVKYYLSIAPTSQDVLLKLQFATSGAGVITKSDGNISAQVASAISDDGSNIDQHPNITNDRLPYATYVPLYPREKIGASLAVSQAEPVSGGYKFHFTAKFKNYGNVNLDSINVIYNIENTYPDPDFASFIGYPTFTRGNLIYNVLEYNGDNNDTLVKFNGNLAVGDSAIMEYDLFVATTRTSYTWLNNMTVFARSLNSGIIISDSSMTGTDPDPSGNNDPQEASYTRAYINYVVPGPPVVNNAIYVYGTTKPANIGGLVKSTPTGTIPVWCIAATGKCLVTPPVTPTEIGRYIYELRSYDTTTLLYSGVSVYDTVIIKPPVPIVKNATYIIGLSTNPANVSVLVTGLANSLITYQLQSVKLTSVPTLVSIPGTTHYTVYQTVNWIESDTVGFNVTMLNQNDMVHLQKIAETPVLQSNSTFNITYKFIVNNLTEHEFTNVLLTDNLQNTIPITSEYSILSIRATGGLVANTGFNGSSDIYMSTSISKVAAYAKDTLVFTLNIKPKGFFGVMNNTANIVATSPFGPVSMVSSAVAKNAETTKLPTPVTLPDVIIDIPEVFTPNRDGVNDKFVILKPYGTTLDLEIFNRWGNVVYVNSNYNNEWDGRGTNNFLGQDLLDGGYYYNLKAINKNGETKIFKGFVIIQR